MSRHRQINDRSQLLDLHTPTYPQRFIRYLLILSRLCSRIVLPDHYLLVKSLIVVG